MPVKPATWASSSTGRVVLRPSKTVPIWGSVPSTGLAYHKEAALSIGTARLGVFVGGDTLRFLSLRGRFLPKAIPHSATWGLLRYARNDKCPKEQLHPVRLDRRYGTVLE